MRLLVNENISGSVIRALREGGHDVLSAKESMRSQPDENLLARAQAEGRVLVTHDKDFGELAFRSGLSPKCGVILLRLAGLDAETDNHRAVEAIESRADWPGHFAVVSDDRIRMRPLPPRA